MNLKLGIVSRELAARHATRAMALQAVRSAFVALSAGEAQLFPVAMGRGMDPTSVVNIKAGLSAAGVVGLKAGTYWPGNRSLGLANHGATTLLLDPQTGRPFALVNVATLNGLRTAAADAAAVDALARPDARVLAVIGTGNQAQHDVRAIHDVRPLSAVRLWNRTRERAEAFARSLHDLEIGRIEVFDSADQAVCEADLVVTATTSTGALFGERAVQAGTHISAMGTDRPGKQELPSALLLDSRLFADHPPQSVQIGELQHLPAAGAGSSITAIGDVIAGRTAGRRSRDEITVFDSSGVAAQDIAIALAIVEAARSAGELVEIDF